MAESGVTAEIAAAEWSRFQRDLGKIAPETRKALRKELKQLLRVDIIPAAKRHSSWSSRIPGQIKPQVTGKRLGLRVAARKAPHARPFEGISGATFRHPVFGNRENWVTQSARPFLKPAVTSNRDEFMAAAGAAINDAAREAGWND